MEDLLNIEHVGIENLRRIWKDGLLKGYPTENRLLVVTPKETTTRAGIYIPGNDEDTIPKKGRVLQIGPIGEEYERTYGEQLEIGDYVHYGLYAGKEVEMSYLGIDSKKFLITILSLTEILYVEKSEHKL